MDQFIVRDYIINFFQMSITAHNVQPFKLSMSNDSFEIFVDGKRLLPIADPHGRDLLIGLGALLETMAIGLSEHQLKLAEVTFEKINYEKEVLNQRLFLVASFKVDHDEAVKADKLSSFLSKRFSYRGKFEINSKIESEIIYDDKIKLILKSNQKNEIGKIFDRTNLKFLSKPNYVNELYSWLRFSRRGNNYYKDGLNVESMGLSKLDAIGAEYVLKPKLFRCLRRLKLISLLITEKPIIESSSAVVAIVGASQDPIDVGRGFMRGWLKLTELNLYGAPLSLLTDDEESMKKMRLIFNVKSDEVIYNILRVGPLADSYSIPPRARLSKEDIYVDL